MVGYHTGQIIEGFKNHGEGVQLDIDDCGATVLAFYNRPTQTELEQFCSGNKFEIRFVELNGVIMFTLKIGNLDWMDAPYSVHLSRCLTEIPRLEKGQGLALTLMVVDTATGKIKHMRLLSLSGDFCKSLFAAMAEQKEKAFNIEEYCEEILNIYFAFTSEQLAEMGRGHCCVNSK